jgi:hypothetical protein
MRKAASDFMSESRKNPSETINRFPFWHDLMRENLEQLISSGSFVAAVVAAPHQLALKTKIDYTNKKPYTSSS